MQVARRSPLWDEMGGEEVGEDCRKKMLSPLRYA